MFGGDVRGSKALDLAASQQASYRNLSPAGPHARETGSDIKYVIKVTARVSRLQSP